MTEASPPQTILSAHAEAKAMLRDLAARATAFDPGLFGDPAWAILTDLYVSASERRTVSVTDACHAARVPLTTALRYISTLEERGMIRRSADTSDRRRTNLHLTTATEQAMNEFFAATAVRRRTREG